MGCCFFFHRLTLDRRSVSIACHRQVTSLHVTRQEILARGAENFSHPAKAVSTLHPSTGCPDRRLRRWEVQPSVQVPSSALNSSERRFTTPIQITSLQLFVPHGSLNSNCALSAAVLQFCRVSGVLMSWALCDFSLASSKPWGDRLPRGFPAGCRRHTENIPSERKATTNKASEGFEARQVYAKLRKKLDPCKRFTRDEFNLESKSTIGALA